MAPNEKLIIHTIIVNIFINAHNLDLKLQIVGKI